MGCVDFDDLLVDGMGMNLEDGKRLSGPVE